MRLLLSTIDAERALLRTLFGIFGERILASEMQEALP
jgi:hypothetical protein